MATPIAVKFRRPFQPFESWAQLQIADNPALSYGFVLGSASRAQFSISRNDVNAAYLLEAGPMVSIERGDGYLPWIGFITQRRIKAGESTVQYTATDHFGAILAQARTAIGTTAVTMSSGGLISLALREASARGEPPVELLPPGDVGPPITYQLRAEMFDSFLRAMTQATDYEWGLHHSIAPTTDKVETRLQWQRRIGQRGELGVELAFEEGRHFTDIEVIDDSEGYLAAGLAVAGGGEFSARPAVQANAAGRDDGPAVKGVSSRIEGGLRAPGGRAARISSPVFMGTRVVVDQQLQSGTADAALDAAARRAQQSPDLTGRHIAFSVAEGAVNDMQHVRLGARALVRLKTLAFGLGLSAVVRIVGINLGVDGVIGFQCSVEDA